MVRREYTLEREPQRPVIPSPMAYERIISGIPVVFHADLEGVIGDSDKTSRLVATERPIIARGNRNQGIIVTTDRIPQGAIAYSAGDVVKDGDKVYIPITFYRRR